MRLRRVGGAVCGVAVALSGAWGLPCTWAQTPRAAAHLVSTACSPASTPTPSLPITEVMLERVPGGPAYPWQTERIRLQRPGRDHPRALAAFDRLSRRLENSGFFSRRSGDVDTARMVPNDTGYLMIKVVRQGRVAQVWSCNGARDAELSATVEAIHRAANAMRRETTNHRETTERRKRAQHAAFPTFRCLPATGRTGWGQTA